MTPVSKVFLAGGLWLVFLGLSSKSGQALISSGYSMLSDLIKQFEGFSATPYKDSAGKWTIGFGHLIKNNETFGTISQAQAEELLAKDTSGAQSTINNLVTVPLNANQRAALVSFVYNIGSGNFANSTMLRLLNSGDYAGAAKEFERWIYAGGVVNSGLVSRRAKEKRLFQS